MHRERLVARLFQVFLLRWSVMSLDERHSPGSTGYGHFPFGRANSMRPARKAIGRCEAVVVGVYPSAWHIRWTAPAFARVSGGSGGIRAMAVDVEPTVFWDGSSDDFENRLASWMNAVGFVEGDNPGQHGRVSRRSPSTNGASGQRVLTNYLRPLKIEAQNTCFTDIFPAFQVKFGSGHKREQGDAIRDEYDSIAKMMGRDMCTLPPRLQSGRLPAVAAAAFAERIMSDLVQAAAPLVITLGREVWETFLLIPQLQARTPAASFSELCGDGYGATGTIMVGGKCVHWLPLVHPGLLGRPNEWQEAHSRWVCSRPLP